MPDNDPHEMIMQAFLAAQRSGKSDWHRMTIAVLKNRLLNLSNGQFDESDYGAANFSEFVRQFGDTMRLDTSTIPPSVELIGAPLPPKRIRPDLWRAIIDYRSGRTYVWDPGLGQAREGHPEEGLRVLPTISGEDMSAWRSEFVDTCRNRLAEQEAAKLDLWQKNRLPTHFLPAALQKPWNDSIKGRVEQRLETWFDDNGIRPPDELLVSERASPRRVPEDLIALRDLIVDCVRVMTQQELSELRLPPAAVLRAARNRRHS